MYKRILRMVIEGLHYFWSHITKLKPDRSTGTMCYCDTFCEENRLPKDDCCPDYRSFCMGDPTPLQNCDHKGISYEPYQKIQDNCNKW